MARVESARRASEIYNRHTGFSLQITKQGMINDEIYKEENSDWSMQYRNVKSRLQTESADFDRRLSAYLTDHRAIRTA